MTYYSTVHIKPTRDGGWEVLTADIPHDRKPGEGCMSSLGFYHYPREIGLEKAFNELKQYMINRHLEEIAKLQKSLDKLVALTLEQGVQK